MQKITVRRDPGWGVSVTREEEGSQIVIPCRDVRGSFTFPTPTSPLYFCIFGQRGEPNLQGKLPLVFLAEGESGLPQRFFQILIERSKQLSCREFYGDFRRENRELMALFGDMCRYGRVTHIQFKRAAFANNFSVGVGFAREWAQDEALEVPEGTVMRGQLSGISSEDLAQQGIEDRFYAINALRYIIGSVEKMPWQPEEFVSKQGRLARDWPWA